MATTKKEGILIQVQKAMLEILKQYPNGIRATALCEKIHDTTNIRTGTIWTQLKPYAEANSDKISRKEEKRNTFYFLKEYEHNYTESSSEQTSEGSSEQTPDDEEKLHKEEDFYDPFAEYLEINEDKKSDYSSLAECSRVAVWGREYKFPWKWGNPDVIGVFKSHMFSDEIVSVEIKNRINEQEILIGFGQACAYRLFSHKVYLVVPNNESPFMERLEAMCHLLGLGLIFFSPEWMPENKELNASIFSVKLRARKQEPDMYYVSVIMSEVKVFNKLYS